MAIHEKTANGDAIVHVMNLRVVLTEEDGAWFAQGLEIDYAAQGTSLQDVQSRFERGLAATINEHLRVFSSVEHLLKPAPPKAWQPFYRAGSVKAVHSQVSRHLEIHKLNFEGVEYLELLAA